MKWCRIIESVPGVGGSVVEFSPATRETGVRFPVNAAIIFFLVRLSFEILRFLFYNQEAHSTPVWSSE